MAQDYFAPWVPGGSYHIYNRAVALNRMFVTWRHVEKFRATIAERMRPFFELYALGCVGNHFHEHARLRPLDELEKYLRSLPTDKLLTKQRRFLEGDASFQELIGDVFARTFNSYSTSFNISQERTGSLFDQTVRRLRVRDDVVSRRLCGYIHFNAHKHRLWNGHLGLGTMTSYAELASGRSSVIDIDPVLARFGGRASFIDYHQSYLHTHRRHDLDVDELACLGYTDYPHRFTYELNRGQRFRWVAEVDSGGTDS